MRENPRPMLIALAGCALAPVGLGGFLMTYQRVLVYSDRIENHHFGFRRTLDLPTTRVFKVDNNGYTLKDAKGVKIFIYKYMENSQQLFSELSM
jgi:hypothetical protein